MESGLGGREIRTPSFRGGFTHTEVTFLSLSCPDPNAAELMQQYSGVISMSSTRGRSLRLKIGRGPGI
jgi:hypothetical protein